VFSGESELPKELRGAIVPAEDFASKRRLTLLLDLAQDRMREETVEAIFNVTKGKFHPHHTTRVYDGINCKDAAPRKLNTTADFAPERLDFDVLIMPKSPPRLNIEALPVFLACGILPDDALLDCRRLRPPPDMKAFHVHAAEARIDGHSCMVLRTQPADSAWGDFMEYWVDLSRDSAVLRCAQYRQGAAVSMVNMDYAQGPSGWQPKRWTATLYFSGKLFRASTLSVDQYELNPRVEARDFDVPLLPGMIVWKDKPDRPGGSWIFRVGTDGTTLTEVDPVTDAEPGPRESRSGALPAAVTGLVITLGAAGYGLARLRKSARGRRNNASA
jgi:hypothetical protein